MNETFKTELAAFARDIEKLCNDYDRRCHECPLDRDGCCIKPPFDADEIEELSAVVDAVEAYRKRKKPCAEVIDRCVDIYTIEVEVERGAVGATMPAEYFAEGAAGELKGYYGVVGRPATVSVLSAKRFVLESHREGDREDAE